ncbi:MAG: hypothetical protein AB7G93_12330 [Bdellovibrionales bacterium]
MRAVWKRSTLTSPIALIALVVLVALPLLAGGAGELPFPFEGDEQSVVLESRKWLAPEWDLMVEVRVYPGRQVPSDQEAKIWIRRTDGYVWDRIWTQLNSRRINVEAELGEMTGTLILDLDHRQDSRLILQDHIIALSPQP